MAKTIRQTMYFDAPPHEVFQALMDSKKHAAFTGDTAKINPRVGGAFSVFGGWATGKTTRLEKDKIVVQSCVRPISRRTIRIRRRCSTSRRRETGPG